ATVSPESVAPGDTVTVTLDLSFDPAELADLDPDDTVDYSVTLTPPDDATIASATCVEPEDAQGTCEATVEDGTVVVTGQLPVSAATPESTVTVELTFAADAPAGIQTL